MSTKSPLPSDVPAPSTALNQLDVFVGEWTTARKHTLNPPDGRARFEWLSKDKSHSGGFLVLRDEIDHPLFPNSLVLIGPDAHDTAGELFTYHAFDSRGVERVYAMSLRDGVWKIWRSAPGFSQRFTGTFSADGNTITLKLEKSLDGVQWEHDFDLIYTRVKAGDAHAQH